MFSMFKKPVAISHQGGSTERWAIALRSPPSAIEPGAIDHELWLAKPNALGQEGAGWVRDRLEDSLGVDIILNDSLERMVAENEFVY